MLRPEASDIITLDAEGSGTLQDGLDSAGKTLQLAERLAFSVPACSKQAFTVLQATFLIEMWYVKFQKHMVCMPSAFMT